MARSIKKYQNSGVVDKNQSKANAIKVKSPWEYMQNYLEDTGRNINRVFFLMDVVAQHESKALIDKYPEAFGSGKFEPIQISYSKEKGYYDGPGRGFFHFETGINQGGKTAVNRAINFIKGDLKIDLKSPQAKPFKEIIDAYYNSGGGGDGSVDFNDLSQEAQKFIFVADKIKVDDNSDFNKIMNPEEGLPTTDEIFNFWLKHHKRKTSDRKESYEKWFQTGRGGDYIDEYIKQEESDKESKSLIPPTIEDKEIELGPPKWGNSPFITG